jgi:hypothetical protein
MEALTSEQARASVFRVALRCLAGEPLVTSDPESLVLAALERRLMAARARAEGLFHVARLLDAGSKLDPETRAAVEHLASRAVDVSPPLPPLAAAPNTRKR